MSRDMNRIVAASVLVLVFGAAANARVMRVVIDHRESPAYQGQPFGEAGKYERLSGHAYGELDPKDPLNAIITDLQFAPRNSRGMVEYSATFLLVRPVDLSKASGVLLKSRTAAIPRWPGPPPWPSTSSTATSC